MIRFKNITAVSEWPTLKSMLSLSRLRLLDDDDDDDDISDCKIYLYLEKTSQMGEHIIFLGIAYVIISDTVYENKGFLL